MKPASKYAPSPRHLLRRWALTLTKPSLLTVAMAYAVITQAQTHYPRQATEAQSTQASNVSQPSCKLLDAELIGYYRGGCVNGLADGFGVAAGSAAHYEGEFKAGKKHGYGTKTWLHNGDTYKGAFLADHKHGLGTYIWGKASELAGYRYKGYFEKDLRQGYGEFTWPNGDTYQGQWQADQQIDGLTTMQHLQRAHIESAYKATQVASAPKQVCQLKYGFYGEVTYRAEVLNVDAQRLHLRIVEPKVLQNNEIIAAYNQWQLCPAEK